MSIKPTSLRARFLVEHLDIRRATSDEQAVWEDPQLEILNCTDTFYITNKARQIGMSSLGVAADAVAAGVLAPGTVSQFVSFNLDEASEKIRFAHSVIEALHPSVRPKLKKATGLELEFANGSRLISLPSKPPRGKPKPRIFLDEYAHVRDGMDVEIFRAAIGSLGRAGCIRVLSTPLGQRGKFYELLTDVVNNPDWTRGGPWPWYLIHGLCTDVETARVEAPGMPTAERVARWGTARLKQQWAGFGSDEDGFRQELECEFVDEEGAFLAYELIMSCEDPEYTPEIRGTGPLYFGLDIGAKHDRSVLVGLERDGDLYRLALLVAMHRVPLPEQERRFRAIIDETKPRRVCIDEGGLGLQIAQALREKFGSKVEPVSFTLDKKHEMFGRLRMELEKHRLLLPADRQLRADLHAIRATRTPMGAVRYDASRTKEGHADRGVGLALAVTACPAFDRAPAVAPIGSGSRAWGGSWGGMFGDRSGF